ncbi:MAG: C-GCAxxG-C-C family protein [Spirochaetales bacterium]|jgi:C_GCAxxG_C_C family probable redox protein|nr:C-GCAxxG-C-C family protein [Spirochaetales bacterium]
MDLHIAEIIKNDYMKKEGLNCAETILRVANSDLGLGLDKNALLLAAGFGGGMGVGNVCGALTGAIMVLSRLCVKDRAHESTRIKDVEKKFIGAFEKEFGTLLCAPIKSQHFHPDHKCRAVVLKAAEILEDILRSDPEILAGFSANR